MQEFVVYWLKVAAVMVLFYLFFKIMLSRETFHRLNRVVLLASGVLSFVLPLCVITIRRTVTVEAGMLLDGNAQLSFVEQGVFGAAAAEGGALWSVLLGVMLLGAAGVVVWTLVSVISLHRLIRCSREVEQRACGRVLLTRHDVTPFSWFGNILLSERDYAESGQIIIAHEEAHIRLHHSVDMLLINLLLATQWFNPAAWLLRRDLREIHEYEADEAVLRSGVSAKEYQLLLIKKAVGNKSYSIANSLNHSTLKNRITMMLQKKSTPASRMRILYVLPLVCMSLTAFAQRETQVVFADKVTENSSEKQDTMNIVAVSYTPEEAPKFSGEKIDEFAYWVARCVTEHSKMDSSIFGEVVVQFTVEADGDIDRDKIVILKDSKDSEWLPYIVKDIVDLSSGSWIPATNNGVPTAITYALPVKVERIKTSTSNGEVSIDADLTVAKINFPEDFQ